MFDVDQRTVTRPEDREDHDGLDWADPLPAAQRDRSPRTADVEVTTLGVWVAAGEPALDVSLWFG